MTAYLDWNATSPPHESVLRAMQSAEDAAWGNPASVHARGRRARDLVESARETLAAALCVEARDVVWTSGGTEANHLALAGASAIVTSRLEHPSIVREAEQAAERGVCVTFVEVGPAGFVAPDAVAQALQALPPTQEPSGRLGAGGSTVVVAVMAANHETGVVQPMPEVARVVHQYGAWLHVDAVQALGRMSLDQLAEADSLAVAAHKLRGPKGIGALAVRRGRRLVARGLGGSQERGLRAGTVDARACVGFAAAVQRLDESMRGYAACRTLRDRFEAALAARATGQLVVHGASAERLPHVTNFGIVGQRGDELVAALDLLGVYVSSGSACAAGTAEPSPVITALAGREAARAAVRVSFGEASTEADLETLLAACERLGLLERPSSLT